MRDSGSTMIDPAADAPVVDAPVVDALRAEPFATPEAYADGIEQVRTAAAAYFAGMISSSTMPPMTR